MSFVVWNQPLWFRIIVKPMFQCKYPRLLRYTLKLDILNTTATFINLKRKNNGIKIPTLEENFIISPIPIRTLKKTCVSGFPSTDTRNPAGINNISPDMNVVFNSRDFILFLFIRDPVLFTPASPTARCHRAPRGTGDAAPGFSRSRSAHTTRDRAFSLSRSDAPTRSRAGRG